MGHSRKCSWTFLLKQFCFSPRLVLMSLPSKSLSSKVSCSHITLPHKAHFITSFVQDPSSVPESQLCLPPRSSTTRPCTCVLPSHPFCSLAFRRIQMAFQPCVCSQQRVGWNRKFWNFLTNPTCRSVLLVSMIRVQGASDGTDP